MTPMNMAKLTIALIAAVFFLLGIRNDSSALRFAGIGFLVAAVLLRFAERYMKRDR